jgi:hypothetical protein
MSMNKTLMRRAIRAAVVICVAGAMCGIGTAEARNPERVFRGQIVTATKRLPTSARSVGKYISTLKKLRKKKFWENKTKKSWKIYYAAFFRRPLNDLEVTVKLYDITDGRKKLVSSFEQYLDTRGQKSVISYVELERQYFGVNRQILMVMETRGYVLASTKFHILGEAEKYSGKVTFTEEETREPTSE